MVSTIAELIAKYDGSNIIETDKLKFNGVDGYDVYNLTNPFENNGKLVLAGRVERRDSEHSKIMFFEMLDASDKFTWTLVEDLPTYELQDPYYSFVDGKLLLGGTEIFDHPTIPNALWYRAEKLLGNDIEGLNHLCYGPNGMKDIRVCDLGDRILVFTRPQGEIGGRGTIGYFYVNTVEEITVEAINNATLIDQFIESEWGGCNQAFLLKNGKVGVLGHIAKFDDEENRHYYSMAFAFDPSNNSVTEMEMICERKYLVDGETKRPDLVDVLFSGGIVRNNDGTADLYTGVSDCECHYVKINDPFLRYEEN